MDGTEQREFSRLPLQITAVFQMPEGGTTIREVGDMSMNGFRTTQPIPLNVDEVCPAQLMIGKGEHDFCIHVQVRVARHTDSGSGLQIQSIEGDTDLGHLRNLLLHHAESAERLESEFDAHSGLNRRSGAE